MKRYKSNFCLFQSPYGDKLEYTGYVYHLHNRVWVENCHVVNNPFKKIWGLIGGKAPDYGPALHIPRRHRFFGDGNTVRS